MGISKGSNDAGEPLGTRCWGLSLPNVDPLITDLSKPAFGFPMQAREDYHVLESTVESWLETPLHDQVVPVPPLEIDHASHATSAPGSRTGCS